MYSCIQKGWCNMRRYELPKIGDDNGGLTVEEVKPATWGSGKRTTVLCRCRCGKSGIEVEEKKFRSKHTTSCGCAQHRQADKSRTAEYRAWSGMMQRCTVKTNKAYKRYGARGIKVCERWRTFANFLEDVGLKPSKDHSLGRQDDNGIYEPGNVRWETKEQQANNCSDNRMITWNGKTQTMAQWSRECNIPYSRLRMRLVSGWKIEDALTKPKGFRRP